MGGNPKALLTTTSGDTFIHAIAQRLRAISPAPENIMAVLGFHREKLLPTVEQLGLTPVTNPDPERGMLSSLQTAIKACDGDCSGVLLCLVDHPLVRDETYRKVLETAIDNPGTGVIPTIDKRGGHPVFFPREFFPDLMDAPLDQGARYAVKKNQERIIRIITCDPGIRHDIDTPAIYRKVIAGDISGEKGV